MTIDIESTLQRKLIFHYQLLSGGMYRDSTDSAGSTIVILLLL